ncbi:hypothetical protein ACSLVK_12370 [Photorhabdus tasmaniensis]|uniref:hypothetical protein n=1 Tax=Photorhabdus tasmaniensis TaxID=1004159 RepID=UPI0040425ED3
MILNFGWKLGSFDDYREAYNLYGGSVITSPKVLDFFHKRFQLNEKFYIKRDGSGNIIGGICSWRDRYLAGEQKIVIKEGVNKYPLNFDEIILPIRSDVRSIIPFKSKFTSSKNKVNIINCSDKLNSKRQICLVKDISRRTRETRNRELNRFIKSGGSVVNVDHYDPKELTDIYDYLYFKRRNEHAYKNEMQEILEEIPSITFGNVLWLEGNPCAMQFIVKEQCEKWICYDYVNSGMDLSYPNLSLGTVSTWVNVKDAIEYSRENDLEMRFSFGRPTFEYKNRWCNRDNLQRVIFP